MSEFHENSENTK